MKTARMPEPKEVYLGKLSEWVNESTVKGFIRGEYEVVFSFNENDLTCYIRRTT